MDLVRFRENPTRFGIGLSVNEAAWGVDAALVRVKGHGPGLHIKLVHYERIGFPHGLRHRLHTLQKSVKELGLLHFEVGAQLAGAAAVLQQIAVEQDSPAAFVALQGFPAAHVPSPTAAHAAGVLELGEPGVVAERTGLPVVAGFTARDIAAGGKGRPLGAYVDWLLFAREDRTSAVLHLGPYASLTVVPPVLEQVSAFEVGPCGELIDGMVRLVTNGTRDSDPEGAMARKGDTIDDLQEDLLARPYYSRVPPKSAIRGEFTAETYLRDLVAKQKSRPLEDFVATATAVAEVSIARAYARFVKPLHSIDRLIVSGAGVRNEALMERLRKGIDDTVIRTSDDYGLAADALEPLRIAVIGSESLCGMPTAFPRATGTSHPTVLGSVVLPSPRPKSPD